MKKSIFSILIFSAILFSCGSKPDIYVQSNGNIQLSKTMVVLPFANFSGKEDAGKQVYNAFLLELLKKRQYNIVEPGEIDNILREERIRITDRIDNASLEILKNRLNANYVLIGAVNEYDYVQNAARPIPYVAFTIRILDVSNGRIVWAADQSRRGDDGEFLFGWGLVSSISKLTTKSVKQVISKIKLDSK